MSDAAWKGRVFLGDDFVLYLGPVGATELHAHHAIQLLASFGDPIPMMGSDGEPFASEGFAIPADELHALGGFALHAVGLYVEPESSAGGDLGKALRAMHHEEGPAAVRWAHHAQPWSTSGLGEPPNTAPEARSFVAAWLERYGIPHRAGRSRDLHPIARRALRILDDAKGDLPFAELAARLGLSERRVSQVFHDELGMPYRPYLRFRRMRRATLAVARGATITEAAHEAGFADAAHLSRTYKRLFGIPFSQLAAFATWIDCAGAEAERP